MAASAFELEPEMTSDERLTLLDLVLAVQDAAENDADIVATLRHMAETGHFHFDSGGFEDLPWAA
jgi:hypothetical protein